MPVQIENTGGQAADGIALIVEVQVRQQIFGRVVSCWSVGMKDTADGVEFLRFSKMTLVGFDESGNTSEDLR
ncbi:MAG TPA: hypothetical protein VM118_13485, partial [Acidobacteriota bacterium]|nr:hypothetical protein [Acidobacteriota bacterium]